MINPDLHRSEVKEPRAIGWSGKPPATEDDITQLEARLGRSMPPSYRALLQASNGFRLPIELSVSRLRPTGRVQWYRTENQSMIDIVKQLGVYDLSNMLQISDLDFSETAVYLLNPDVVAADGEWQAVHFVGGDAPNCLRFSSLWELLQSKYQLYVPSYQRRSSALVPDPEVLPVFDKLPILIGQFDRTIRVLREDPYLAGPPWRDKVLGIMQMAKARVMNLVNDRRTAPVTLDYLHTLVTEFNSRAEESGKIEYPGGGYVDVFDKDAWDGWRLAATHIREFLADLPDQPTGNPPAATTH
jgi:hypothetical protein